MDGTSFLAMRLNLPLFTTVFRNNPQMQARVRLVARPADPAVAHTDLEGAGLLTHQCQPALTVHRYPAHGAPEQPLARQTVMAGDQLVRHAHWPHLSGAQIHPPCSRMQTS